MPLQFPSFEDFFNEYVAVFKTAIPEIDPTIKGWSQGFGRAAAAVAKTNVVVLDKAVKQFFPQTSTGEFLDLWASYENLERLSPRGSSGLIAYPADAGTLISQGEQFTSGGFTYSVQADQIAALLGGAIATIERVGDIATATLDIDITFATGMSVLVANAIEPEYNGTFIVTVINRNQFTYTVEGTPSTPATGSPTWASEYASLSVLSDQTGAESELINGSQLIPPTSLSSTTGGEFAFVGFAGVSGGGDLETDAQLLERILLSRSIVPGIFTNSQIRLAALSVAGNTRVFIVNPELNVSAPSPAPGDIPAPGQVAVYFLRDNDPTIIPDQNEIDITKDAIAENGALPSHTSIDDLLVFAPILVPVDVTISNLLPNTPTMQDAVRKQVEAYFEDVVDFQKDVRRDGISGAINNTQDLVTGELIESFVLVDPATDVTIGSGEIASVGAVTFI